MSACLRRPGRQALALARDPGRQECRRSCATAEALLFARMSPRAVQPQRRERRRELCFAPTPAFIAPACRGRRRQVSAVFSPADFGCGSVALRSLAALLFRGSAALGISWLTSLPAATALLPIRSQTGNCFAAPVVYCLRGSGWDQCCQIPSGGRFTGCQFQCEHHQQHILVSGFTHWRCRKMARR